MKIKVCGFPIFREAAFMKEEEYVMIDLNRGIHKGVALTILELFDSFLDERGIVIENEEKEESENPSNIYGTDFATLEDEIVEILHVAEKTADENITEWNLYSDNFLLAEHIKCLSDEDFNDVMSKVLENQEQETEGVHLDKILNEIRNQQEDCVSSDKTENIDTKDRYIPSASAGDYSPGNPWDAPGMSIRDFI